MRASNWCAATYWGRGEVGTPVHKFVVHILASLALLAFASWFSYHICPSASAAPNQRHKAPAGAGACALRRWAVHLSSQALGLCPGCAPDVMVCAAALTVSSAGTSSPLQCSMPCQSSSLSSLTRRCVGLGGCHLYLGLFAFQLALCEDDGRGGAGITLSCALATLSLHHVLSGAAGLAH